MELKGKTALVTGGAHRVGRAIVIALAHAGAKAVAEIPLDGVAPAVANAVYDAIGVRIRSLPLTPERVWREQAQAAGTGALPA